MVQRTILLACFLLASRGALAALAGQPLPGSANPVERTPATTSAGVAYTDVSRTLGSGTQVHEFTDASGTVFALSWSGPFKPNLSQLLGRRFEAFRHGQGHRRGNASPQRVTTDDMVVVQSGHMGAFEGRAWLPSLLPAGFDPEEMK